MNDLILKSDIEKLYNKSRQAFETAAPGEEKKCSEAYARGVKDALEIVRQHIENQSVVQPSPEPEQAPPQKRHRKPHQMSIEAVSKLIMQSSSDPGSGLETYTAGDLTEAAFRFENEMMACLGDDNTIPFDSYTGMAPGQLVSIIKTSVAKIEELK